MATTPVTPAPVVTSKTNWWAIIIPLLIIALFAAGVVYEIDSLVSRLDAANASKYQSVLVTQAAETKTLQQQLAADSVANAVRDAGYQKTISQLSQSIAIRDANVKKQQAVDNTLDAATAAQRLALQTKAGLGEVNVSGNQVILDLPITRVVVSDLDSIPVLQSDLADTKSQLTAQVALTGDAKKEATDAESVVASQTVQLADSAKSCTAQVAALKATARKSKFRWFGAGFIVGFVSGVLTHGV